MTEEEWEKIYQSRITPTTQLEESRVLLEYDQSEIWAEGALSCIVGAAKSRKTFALSLLLEQMLTPSEPGFKSNFGGEVLYFDTEMSDRRVQLVSQRFTRPELITLIPIRQYSIVQRYNIIEESIKRIRPNLVVIDGYKELVLDINDQRYATKLTNKLLQWTTEFKCHITGILHTNPDSKKPRGALGTEMINKCASVMHVEARSTKSRVSPLFSRDKEFNPFIFTVDTQGSPRIHDSHGL